MYTLCHSKSSKIKKTFNQRTHDVCVECICVPVARACV